MTFIAMEYYAFILNRTFEVYLCADGLVGIKVAGVVGASLLYTQSKYRNPRSFINDRFLKRYDGQEICGHEILGKDSHNFKLLFSNIDSVDFIAKRKWGMGPVPHSGLLSIKFKNIPRPRELILLGDQDGYVISKEIIAKIQSGVSRLG